MSILFALLLAAGTTPPSTEEAMVVHLKDAKFAQSTAPGMPQGVAGAPIGVDPNTKGPTGYAKIAPGTKVPEHTHSYAEYTVVLSGNATLMINDKAQEVSAGDYFIIPAKTRHSLACGPSADCVQLTRRAGPVDYNWVKTAEK
jgi:quercetin dioxygenase-like cupin family protein